MSQPRLMADSRIRGRRGALASALRPSTLWRPAFSRWPRRRPTTSHYVEQPRQKTQRSPFAAESLLKPGRAPRAARRDPPHRRSDPNRCARRARGEPAEGATKAPSARRITRSTFSSCHVSAHADDADGPDRDTNFGTVSTPALRGGRDEPSAQVSKRCSCRAAVRRRMSAQGPQLFFVLPDVREICYMTCVSGVGGAQALLQSCLCAIRASSAVLRGPPLRDVLRCAACSRRRVERAWLPTSCLLDAAHYKHTSLVYD